MKKITKVIGAVFAGTALITGSIVCNVGMEKEKYNSLVDKGYCTVLVYMDGSDLESSNGAAANDLEEMQNAVAEADPSGENIRIVVEAGGAIKWKFEPMKPYKYGRFCITGKGVSEVESMPVRNMGKSDTLADFVNYATISYPAEHYGMIFWNHGAGQLDGFGKDENFKGSSLGLDEIKDGLEQSDFDEAFEFVGMDACLMSNIELVSTLQGKANYLIASEDLEPEQGYEYAWMEQLTTKSKDYGKEIGTSIVEYYNQYYKNFSFRYTLVLIDINKYGDFHKLFDNLMNDFTDESYKNISKIRDDVQSFGNESYTEIAEIVDLMEMIQKMYELGFCTEEEYQSIVEAYSLMVVCDAYGGFEQKPGGISIYLPVKKCSDYQDIDFCNKYKSFIKEYCKYLSTEKKLGVGDAQNDMGDVKVAIPKNQIDEIANAYNAIYFCDDNAQYLISSDRDVFFDKTGYISAPAENRFWGLKSVILCMIEQYSNDEMTEYFSPVLYKKRDIEWQECKIIIEFSDEYSDGEIMSIEPREVNKQIYVLEDGDEIIPLYPIYDADYKIDSSKQVYDDKYYKGELITMNDIYMGDGMLDKIEIKDMSLLRYGFIIRDLQMNLHEVEPVQVE